MVRARPEPFVNADSKPYWMAIKEGRLVLQKCVECDHVDFMPRHICPVCWSDNRTWIDASGTGTIHSFSIVHRSPLPVFRDDCPYVVALIDLTEGPRIMTNIIGESALKVAIGDAVAICFEDRGNLRIPQFQRVTDGSGM